MDDNELREIQIQYFHLALEEWQNVRDTLHESWSEARNASSIPLLWSESGGLNEAVREINKLAVTLRRDVLRKGFIIVGGIRDTLGEVAQNYVINMAASEEEASQLEEWLENGR